MIFRNIKFFTLLDKYKIVVLTDKDGDKYLRSYYNALDKDGNRCGIVMDDYYEFTNTDFYIRYSDILFLYVSRFVHGDKNKFDRIVPERPIQMDVKRLAAML